MPICQLKTNYSFSDATRREFLDEVAKTLSQILDKPLPAVMVMLDDSAMYMNQSEDTVFFAEFRYVQSITDAEEKSVWQNQFADTMLALFQKHTKVDPYRIYMQFTEMPRESAWRYTGEERMNIRV